jgi:hypothetical protein
MNIKLTAELRIALELRHSKVRDGYERDRIKAVLLHAKKVLTRTGTYN